MHCFGSVLRVCENGFVHGGVLGLRGRASVPRSAFLRTLAIHAADECGAVAARASLRVSAPRHATSICCSPSPPLRLCVPSFSRGWNDSDSVWRQQGRPLFSLWSVSLWQDDWLENGSVVAHIRRMSTIVQCNCGAEYRRTEEKFLEPHTGDAVCEVCGAALESWWSSTHVPTYELIERPRTESGHDKPPPTS